MLTSSLRLPNPTWETWEQHPTEGVPGVETQAFCAEKGEEQGLRPGKGPGTRAPTSACTLRTPTARAVTDFPSDGTESSRKGYILYSELSA